MNVLLTTFYIIGLAGVIVLVLYVRRSIMRSSRELPKKIIRKIEGMVRFNSLFRAILEIYFYLCLNVFKEISNLSFDN